MRVLALVHQYIPARCAGAETHLHAMLSTLAHRGHHVDVTLSRQTGEPYELDGVNVWPLVDRKRDPFRWLADTDLLVTHLENTHRATVLGHLNDIPVAVVHHNTFLPAREALTMWSSRTDLVVVNSEWMAADLTAWLEDRGMWWPTVIVRPIPEAVAAPPPVAGDMVTLVNLRRLSDGPDQLSKGGELFRQLAERMPDTRFLGVTGAYGVQQELADLDNVEVIDHVPHHRMGVDVWARTRVLLVPSSYESWGRVASEAIAAGIPVVAHPTPGLRENLGDAGIFVDRDDVDGWVEALRTLARPQRWKAARGRALTRAAAHQEMRICDLEEWVSRAERLGGRRHPVAALAGA